ncbi:MAG: type VI secretion system baseplate subunit TssK, partial [Desulfohalobiaceae bacterium]
FYRVELPERVLQGGRSFWLVLKTESDPDWVFDSVGRLLKLSPSSGMTTILSQAVSGIPLSGQTKPPAGLPRQANAFYFRIHTDSHLWEEVCNSRQLSMFWDEPPEDLIAQIAVLSRGS